MLRRTTKSAACLLAGVALVAGCSAEPEDAPPLSPSAPATTAAPPSVLPTPTPSPTWSPAIALPTPPPEMARDDEVGAVAAATYFLTELYPYTVSSQDTAAWQAMSHPSCNYCSGIVAAVESERESNVVTHPGVILVKAQTTSALNPLAYGVKLDLSLGRDIQVSRDGEVLNDREPKTVQMGTVAVWQVDRWLIRGVDVLIDDGVPQ